MDGDRSRTVTWADPVEAAEAGARLPGIDFLRAMAEGTLPAPPIARLMGFQIEEVAEGRVVFVAETGEHLYNPIGTVHGGVAATLLDSAMGCAVHSLLPAGRGYTTLEIKVNFVRPLRRDTGTIRAAASVVHLGGKIATAEGRVIDGTGKVYAHGTTTCLILDAKTA